jgi:hypothetical protein
MTNYDTEIIAYNSVIIVTGIADAFRIDSEIMGSESACHTGKAH